MRLASFGLVSPATHILSYAIFEKLFVSTGLQLPTQWRQMRSLFQVSIRKLTFPILPTFRPLSGPNTYIQRISGWSWFCSVITMAHLNSRARLESRHLLLHIRTTSFYMNNATISHLRLYLLYSTRDRSISSIIQQHSRTCGAQVATPRIFIFGFFSFLVPHSIYLFIRRCICLLPYYWVRPNQQNKVYMFNQTKHGDVEVVGQTI